MMSRRWFIAFAFMLGFLNLNLESSFAKCPVLKNDSVSFWNIGDCNF